ncbi:MAG: DUF2922 domain-containing protein [Candidatus Moduliflexus flocculans]|nr:DUF2922 domain-containing protein [Candidatus Moduliflexus flocculans]
MANANPVLSMAYPKDGKLTQAEIETAMQAVIDHAIFAAGPNKPHRCRTSSTAR